ncbi:MAG: YeeE/YedE family protein [Thiogranum sp.]|nr:YeeE/YedE family protein [Thiogranum sp.]
MKHVAVFAAGLLFALGLGISGMTLPQKVIGFLDFAGDAWDPSLALVMVSSAGVYLLLHRRVLRRPTPLFDTQFHVPDRTDIDAPLVFGSALFGIGWGMVGFCPGPALTALVSGQTQVWSFFVAMIAGMYAEGTLNVSNRIVTGRGEAVDG